MSKIRINSHFDLLRGGEGMESFVQNICKKCEWQGQKHYAHNDYQHSNCREERKRHQKVCK